MPTDVTSVTGAADQWRAPARAPKNELGTDTFLNLLVAQLKYQNPLSPSDGTEFLAQTAQFTMVEKITELADLTKSLLNDNQSLAAATLLGRTVSWADADGEIRSGTVTAATFGAAGPNLVVDGEQIPLSHIRDVSA